MSERGRELFDKFIEQRLIHPQLRDAPLETHLSDLLDMAGARDVAWTEIVEEVGEITDALTAALAPSRKEMT